MFQALNWPPMSLSQTRDKRSSREKRMSLPLWKSNRSFKKWRRKLNKTQLYNRNCSNSRWKSLLFKLKSSQLRTWRRQMMVGTKSLTCPENPLPPQKAKAPLRNKPPQRRARTAKNTRSPVAKKSMTMNTVNTTKKTRRMQLSLNNSLKTKDSDAILIRFNFEI